MTALPCRHQTTMHRIDRLGGRVGWTILLSVWVLGSAVTACGDDASGTTAGDAGLDPVVDGATDSMVDPVDEADGDLGEPDAGRPDVVEACPGSMECFDPELDRPRAAICIENGFPTGTACVRDERGLACCVPPFACETDDDCEAARAAEGFCEDERFACVCNTIDGSCSPFVCLADSECESDEVCRSGSCTEPGSTAGLIARIVSPPGVIAQGDSRSLVAVAVDAEDPTRVFDDVPISWTSDEADRVNVSAAGVATGGSVTGPAAITARVTDNGSDPGDSIVLTNYADSTADLRVVVIDEASRGPLEGALVFVEPDSGESVTATTDAMGVASFESTLTRPLDVSVFAEGHAYVTHIAVDGDDLLISVAPSTFVEVTPETEPGGENRLCEEVDAESLCFELENLGAVVGTPDFAQVANRGEIDVSLTGFALGNDLLNLDFELVLGPNIQRDLSDGPIPVEDLAEIPGGVTLAFNADPLVPSYVATAVPGSHVLWSLGGRVSLSDNPTLLPDIIEQLEGQVDIARLITIVLPLFSTFYSGVTPEVMVAAPEGEALNLSREDIGLSVPVGRRIFITPPTLPSIEAGSLETGLFLAGASLPGQGFLPLGITAATDGAGDTPTDGVLDGDPESSAVDPVELNMAPIHGGIGGPGTGYVLVSVALPLDPDAADAVGESTSGLITRTPPGDPLPAEVTFDVEAFPALPEGSTWTAETRTVVVVPSEFQADFYRILFKGPRDRLWLVHLPADVLTVELPDPTLVAEGLEDRTQRGKVSVVSVELESASLSYASLLALDGPTLDNLVDFVSGFAVLEIGD